MPVPYLDRIPLHLRARVEKGQFRIILSPGAQGGRRLPLLQQSLAPSREAPKKQDGLLTAVKKAHPVPASFRSC